jgi:hypothetical protein
VSGESSTGSGESRGIAGPDDFFRNLFYAVGQKDFSGRAEHSMKRLSISRFTVIRRFDGKNSDLRVNHDKTTDSSDAMRNPVTSTKEGILPASDERAKSRLPTSAENLFFCLLSDSQKITSYLGLNY